ncbi:hypothetical protein QQX98_000374 [Neonectria punicea]|uniref:Actin-like ATPase domain-containing protein n=1 Tax=Neonectria punicea TaxID=979145 RepID=A0ABR1HV73_9HYPO
MAAAFPGSSAHTPVFVGIDFGTTFSGLSYSIGNTSGTRELRWSGNDRIKFPSRVSSSNGNLLCGPCVPETDQAIEWFKLGLLHPDSLDPKIRKSPIFKQNDSLRLELELTAVEVSGYLLAYMWSTLLGQLERTNPGETFAFFLTIAVPASWSSFSRNSLEAAVEKSKISDRVCKPVSFVTEPEATILGTVMECIEVLTGEPSGPSRMLDLQIGDNVLSFDCGGGTTDTVACTITNCNPPTMTECTPATCTFSGAIRVDDGFMKLLDTKLEREPLRKGFRSEKYKHYQEFARKAWHEDMKVYFGGNVSEWVYDIPEDWLSANRRSIRRQLKFTSEELDPVFEPVLEIAQLVEDQIHLVLAKTSKAPKYVIVSGGFGLNRYVRTIISERVKQVSRDIEHPILAVGFSDETTLGAVSRGAAQHCRLRHGSDPALVQSGLRIGAHVTRASYGIRSPSGGTMFRWLCHEGDTLRAEGSDLYSLRPTEFDVTEEDGKAVLALDLFTQKAGANVQRATRVTWKSGLDTHVLHAASRAVKIQLVYDGVGLRIAVYLDNCRQSDDNVTVVNPYLG